MTLWYKSNKIVIVLYLAGNKRDRIKMVSL